MYPHPRTHVYTHEHFSPQIFSCSEISTDKHIQCTERKRQTHVSLQTEPKAKGKKIKCLTWADGCLEMQKDVCPEREKKVLSNVSCMSRIKNASYILLKFTITEEWHQGRAVRLEDFICEPVFTETTQLWLQSGTGSSSSMAQRCLAMLLAVLWSIFNIFI